MIVITGATGHLGRAIVEHLIARVPAGDLGVSVRDPAKASGLEALGVRVRAGDFTDPAGLRAAFEGASQVLIVSSNARATGGDTLAQHRTAIAAALAAGATRIVYTSHMAASATSAFPPMRDHHATEAMLRECGLPWTSLRNGFYAASGLALALESFTSGVFEAPADGKVSWTAHADLAKAAAIVLTDDGPFEGPTPPLTAAESFDFEDITRMAATALGRPIRREIVADDEFRARLRVRGVPEAAAEMFLGLYLASRSGEFAAIDPTLAALIGGPPISMRDVVVEHASNNLP